ncbi:DTW domain-containing protein 2 [Amphibalanus amphitrite]|uniref:tRNA-uridine aminocarboxypropyltransferase n=1 Tax=Amphibalanus amphitrite TaxID=1232801 RepID=A0A6A4VEE9_AMPAM|nr:DTW domain-containing protein 2 [Amphibalanus amphitrite]
MEDEQLASALSELPCLVEEDEQGREECNKCTRPITACWCPYLPNPPIDVSTNIIILQHPLEERRALRTAPMIQLGLAPGKCTVYRGKKFPSASHVGLAEILRSPLTVILFPGPAAVDVADLPACGESQDQGPLNVLILDGTWRQAKTMYTMSPALHSVRQVMVTGRRCSSYVVRTQPTSACLSTVEAAAACLQHLERRPQLPGQLLQPLHALCRVQLGHGAVPHSSKQELIERGQYERQRGVRTNRMFRQLGVVL